MSEHTRVLDLIQAVDLDGQGSARVGAWLAGHRADVVAGVLACDRDGLRGLGTRLAAAAWPAALLVPDPRWWADLAEAGEAVAIADRDPRALADLLHRAAATFAAHGDRVAAEERWVRALAVLRRDGVAGQDRVLAALGSLYRDWGRLGKALDAYLGLVDVFRDAGDATGTAAALTEVGTTMHAAGRVRSAMAYFDQADEAMSRAGTAAAEHARVLVWCGRTRWEQGQHSAARRRWSQALALLVDVDEGAADRVRALLATEPSGAPDFPYLSNTSSSPSGGVG
jgi:tetratricopeptide (TPR) repeat protein